MKPFEVIPVLTNRCDKMQRYYTNLLEDFEEEEIHQFRLQVKKLKSFLHLLNAGMPKEKVVSMGKKLHAFYRAVGELRNMQLHRAYVTGVCSKPGLAAPDVYLQTIQQKEKEAKENIRRTCLRNPLDHSCRKLQKQVPEAVSEKAVENFVTQNKRTLFKLLLLGNYDDTNLHNIRKLLKSFLYLWPWLEPEMVSLPHSICMEKGACIALCETLGDFMDSCTALRFFKEYADIPPANDAEAATLLLLNQYTLDEKLRLKQEIVAGLQACVQQLWERHIPPLYEFK